MVLRKGVSLHDNGRTGLAIVTGRGNGHQITASHLRQTRRPIRSISARRARDPGRGRRPASPPVVGPPASGGRQRRDATRADPVRGAAAASSSSFRLAPPWTSPSVTHDSVTRYKPGGKGPGLANVRTRESQARRAPRTPSGDAEGCSKLGYFCRTLGCARAFYRI